MPAGISRFVPASADAFKRVARDLQRAYGLKYQQAQELLARLYGFADLHELQAALARGVPPGPFPDDFADPIDALALRTSATARLRELAPDALPLGRLQLHDLGIFERPEARQETMDFETAVDNELEAENNPDRQADPSDYVRFVTRPVVDLGLQATGEVEGFFALTRRGRVVLDAIEYCRAGLNEFDWDDDQSLPFRQKLLRIADNHPNNPYACGAMVALLSPAMLEDLEHDHSEATLWRAARARTGFESVMPAGFKGSLEPNIISPQHPYGVDNYYYLGTLYWGARAHLKRQDANKALSWARRCRRFDVRDTFRSSALIASLKK